MPRETSHSGPSCAINTGQVAAPPPPPPSPPPAASNQTRGDALRSPDRSSAHNYGDGDVQWTTQREELKKEHDQRVNSLESEIGMLELKVAGLEVKLSQTQADGQAAERKAQADRAKAQADVQAAVREAREAELAVARPKEQAVQALRQAQTLRSKAEADAASAAQARGEARSQLFRQRDHNAAVLAQECDELRRAKRDEIQEYRDEMSEKVNSGMTFRQQQRASYKSYRQEVWGTIKQQQAKVSTELGSLWTLTVKKSYLWKQAARQWQQTKPDGIHRYGNIDRQVQAMLDKNHQGEQETMQTLERLNETTLEAYNVLDSAGHLSRTLTDVLRIKDEDTGEAFHVLQLKLIEGPLVSVIEGLKKRRTTIRSELNSTIRSELSSKHLASKRRPLIARALLELGKLVESLRHVLKYLGSVREVKRLETMAQSSDTAGAAAHARTRSIREQSRAASQEWSRFHLGSKHLSLSGDRRVELAKFHERRDIVRNEENELRGNIRKRVLLQESLGLSGQEDIKAIYARDIERAKAEEHKQLNALIGARSEAETSQGQRMSFSPRSPRARRVVSTRVAKKTAWKTAPVATKSSPKPAPGTDRAKRRAFTSKRDGDRGGTGETQNSPEPETAAESSTGSLNITPSTPNKAAHSFWPDWTRGDHGRSLPHRDSHCTFTFGEANSILFSPPTPALEQSISTLVAANCDVGFCDDRSSPKSIDAATDTMSEPSNSQSSYRLAYSSDSSDSPETGAGADSYPTSEVEANSEAESVADVSVDDRTSLLYHIGKEDYRIAVLASSNTATSYWTYKLYKNEDGKAPLVYYCTTLEQAEARAKEFLDESVIGFDIEWEIGHTPAKSGPKKNVSLIQIATDDKIALFHVAVFKGNTVAELMPESLRTILQSKDVAKTGVNIQGDAKRLEQCLQVNMTGLFELSHLYKVVMYSESDRSQVDRKLFKLADQVQNILLLPLKKDAVRTSAWSKRLDIQQTEYAASDAYAGFRLYHALEARRKKMKPTPPRPAFWEEHQPIRLGDGSLVAAKTKKKVAIVEAAKGSVVEEVEEEEFFDAVENLDAYELNAGNGLVAGVPLAGLSISYPTLPSLETQMGALDLHEVASAPEPLRDESASTAQPAPTSKQEPRAEPQAKEQTPPEPKPKEPASKKAGPPPSEQVSLAERWIAEWRSSLPSNYAVNARHTDLRAWHLWHKQSLDCRNVAGLLRDPPLGLQTVASYVLEALKHEDLEFEAGRVREVLGILPTSAHRRYGKVVDGIGDGK